MEEAILALKANFLAAVRVSAVIFMMPGLGSRVFPPVAKIFLTVVVSIIVILSLPQAPNHLYANDAVYAIYIVKEALLGIFIGFFAQLPFIAVKAAGEMISFNTMFSMATVINPADSTQSTVFGEFYNIAAIFVYFAINGHHMLMEAIFFTFRQIPVADMVNFSGGAVSVLNGWGSVIFYAGVAISAAVIAVLLVTNIAMGIISKTMPALNIMIVGLPIQILLAFGVIFATLSVDTGVIRNIFIKMFSDLSALIKLL